MLDHLDTHPPTVRVPLPDDHRLALPWQHWWAAYERPTPCPRLRLIRVGENLAGPRSSDMVHRALAGSTTRRRFVGTASDEGGVGALVFVALVDQVLLSFMAPPLLAASRSRVSSSKISPAKAK